MAAPTWVTGQVLSAADVNSWFVPLAAVKTADQSVTSSTTMVNDSELVLAVAASVTYEFRLFLYFEGGTQGSSDIKWQFTVPSGTNMRYYAVYTNTAGGSATGQAYLGSTVIAAGSGGAGAMRGVTMHGTIVTSTTTGNVQFQWAQNTSSATSTIVHAQSCMTLQRIS